VNGIDKAGWDYGTSPSYIDGIYVSIGNRISTGETEKYRTPLPTFAVKSMVLDFIWLVRLFFRFQKIIPTLVDPVAHSANHEPSFDIVILSLPGFRLSDRSEKPGLTFTFGFSTRPGKISDEV
jgi:hypothetical protein